MYFNNQRNHLQKFMIIIFKRQSFDKGLGIMKVSFLHHVFYHVNWQPPLLHVSPPEACANSVNIVFPICRLGT